LQDWGKMTKTMSKSRYSVGLIILILILCLTFTLVGCGSIPTNSQIKQAIITYGEGIGKNWSADEIELETIGKMQTMTILQEQVQYFWVKARISWYSTETEYEFIFTKNKYGEWVASE
jgi:hypothetical protein